MKLCGLKCRTEMKMFKCLCSSQGLLRWVADSEPHLRGEVWENGLLEQRWEWRRWSGIETHLLSIPGAQKSQKRQKEELFLPAGETHHQRGLHMRCTQRHVSHVALLWREIWLKIIFTALSQSCCCIIGFLFFFFFSSGNYITSESCTWRALLGCFCHSFLPYSVSGF